MGANSIRIKEPLDIGYSPAKCRPEACQKTLKTGFLEVPRYEDVSGPPEVRRAATEDSGSASSWFCSKPAMHPGWGRVGPPEGRGYRWVPRRCDSGRLWPGPELETEMETSALVAPASDTHPPASQVASLSWSWGHCGGQYSVQKGTWSAIDPWTARGPQGQRVLNRFMLNEMLK